MLMLVLEITINIKQKHFSKGDRFCAYEMKQRAKYEMADKRRFEKWSNIIYGLNSSADFSDKQKVANSVTISQIIAARNFGRLEKFGEFLKKLSIIFAKRKKTQSPVDSSAGTKRICYETADVHHVQQ